MLKYFRGCWKLFREIRSLADEHYIAVVNEATASFCPWENPASSDQDQQINPRWLLYRESGKLENYDFPAASGQFTRQYLYKFSPIDSDSNNRVQVFHCSKLSILKDDTDPLNSHFDAKGFKEGDFFHDLVFPKNIKMDSLMSTSMDEPLTAAGQHVCVTSSHDPVTASGQHVCGRDVYQGLFQLYSKDNFRTSWKVTGPEKAFQIVSIYTRLN